MQQSFRQPQQLPHHRPGQRSNGTPATVRAHSARSTLPARLPHRIAYPNGLRTESRAARRDVPAGSSCRRAPPSAAAAEKKNGHHGRPESRALRRPPLLGSVGSCHKRWLAVMAAVCVSASARAERIGLRMLTRAKKAWELSGDRGFSVRHANTASAFAPAETSSGRNLDDPKRPPGPGPALRIGAAPPAQHGPSKFSWVTRASGPPGPPR